MAFFKYNYVTDRHLQLFNDSCSLTLTFLARLQCSMLIRRAWAVLRDEKR